MIYTTLYPFYYKAVKETKKSRVVYKEDVYCTSS